MRLVVHPEARVEIRAVAVWYDDQREGVGDDFLSALTQAFTRVLMSPQTWPKWPNTRNREPLIQKAPVDNFPYAVAYELHAEHILVLAVPHARRRPLYWIDRATSEGR